MVRHLGFSKYFWTDQLGLGVESAAVWEYYRLVMAVFHFVGYQAVVTYSIFSIVFKLKEEYLKTGPSIKTGKREYQVSNEDVENLTIEDGKEIKGIIRAKYLGAS